MQSLTLDDQDVERLLNCLDGQARLPTAMHSFPLTQSEPPARAGPAYRPNARRAGCRERHPGVRDRPPERGAFTTHTPPTPDPSRNAGTATRADALESVATSDTTH